MTFNLMIFNKYQHSLDTFERDLRNFVQANSIEAMDVVENPANGDILFEFTTSDQPLPPQDIAIFGFADSPTLVSVINSNLDGARELRRRPRFVKVVPLTKSNRSIGIILFEVESTNEETKSETKKRNKRTNAKSVSDG